MPKVEILSGTSNQITKADSLQALSQVMTLRQLNVAANPLAEEDGVNIRHEVLIFQQKLEKIDGEDVTPEEKDEAKALNEARIAAEEEAKRIAAEEEEAKRLAAEEEAKNEETSVDA